MFRFSDLIKNTYCYKIIASDKEKNNLSHAYLISMQDKFLMNDYMTHFAKLIMCEGLEPTENDRACQLIEKHLYTDVVFYPLNEDKILVSDVENLIENSYIKPMENSRKLFVLENTESMTVQAQNKLLKTLEEPPDNVILLLGTTSDYALLPTLRSRVKRLEIPLFEKSEMFEALHQYFFQDDVKLSEAVVASGGLIGKAENLLGSDEFFKIIEFVYDMLKNMLKSSQVLEYSVKMQKYKNNLSDVLDVLKLVLRDIILLKEHREDLISFKEKREDLEEIAQTFKTASALLAIDSVIETERAIPLNTNINILTDNLLLSILEGKYKWRK